MNIRSESRRTHSPYCMFVYPVVSDADRMREKQKLADLKKQGLLPESDEKPKDRGNKDRAKPKPKQEPKSLVVHNKKKK